MTGFSYTRQNNIFGNYTPEQLTAEYGSPLYVYNERIFRRRCREMQNLIQGQPFTANYSIKANSNLHLLKIARAEGLYADAMSPGEILILEQAGYSSDQIFFVPNNVDTDELRFAIERDILTSLDSLDQVELYGQINPGGRIAVRINPGVGAGHHEKVVTAGKKTKFGIGMDKIDELQKLLDRYNLRLEGINQHIGSLFMEPEPYLQAAENFLQIAAQFKNLRLIDFGGGFGIPYRKLSGQPRLDLEALGSKLSAMVADFAAGHPQQLLFKTEPGRYIAAECGVLIGKVNALKENGGTSYIGTDIGFNVLARPVMYDSWHDIEVYRDGMAVPATDNFPQTIVGNICESGDIIARDRELPAVRRGDSIVILDAGAYGYAMSSNYNNRLRPAEILIAEDGEARLIRRRDTYEDLFRQYDINR
jgi:diaminopimelate decarboxylase